MEQDINIAKVFCEERSTKAEPMRDDELFKRRRSDAIYQFDGREELFQ